MDEGERIFTYTDPVALMDERVPPEFLFKLQQCVLNVYPKAHKNAMAHESGLYSYMVGHERYALLEAALCNINYPNVSVRIRHIRGLFRVSQVVINGVLFTASSNIVDDKLPRPAHFRELLSLCTVIETPHLFGLERQVETGFEDVDLYGILCHGKDKENPTVPAFVGIQFPDRAYQNITGRVDLLQRFPLATEVPTVETQIKPEVRIKPKRINE